MRNPTVLPPAPPKRARPLVKAIFGGAGAMVMDADATNDGNKKRKRKKKRPVRRLAQAHRLPPQVILSTSTCAVRQLSARQLQLCRPLGGATATAARLPHGRAVKTKRNNENARWSGQGKQSSAWTSSSQQCWQGPFFSKRGFPN